MKLDAQAFLHALRVYTPPATCRHGLKHEDVFRISNMSQGKSNSKDSDEEFGLLNAPQRATLHAEVLASRETIRKQFNKDFVCMFEDACYAKRSNGSSLLDALQSSGTFPVYVAVCRKALESAREPNAILALGPLLGHIDERTMAAMAGSMDQPEFECDAFMHALQLVMVAWMEVLPAETTRLIHRVEEFCLGGKKHARAVLTRGEFPTSSWSFGVAVELLGQVAGAEMPASWLSNAHSARLHRGLPLEERVEGQALGPRDVCFECRKSASAQPGSKKLLSCSRCKSAHFCGSACQKLAHASGRHRKCAPFDPEQGPVQKRVALFLAATLRLVARLGMRGVLVATEEGSMGAGLGGEYGVGLSSLFKLRCAEAHFDVALAYESVEGISMWSGGYSEWLKTVGLPALASDKLLKAGRGGQSGLWVMAGQHSEQELDGLHRDREAFVQGANAAAQASSQVALERRKYSKRLAPVASAAEAFSADVTDFLEQHFGCTTEVFAPASKTEPLGAEGFEDDSGSDDGGGDGGGDAVNTGGSGSGGGEPVSRRTAPKGTLVERWAAACPSTFPMPRHCSTVREMMAATSLDDEAFLARVEAPVGDWAHLLGLLKRTRKKVSLKNKPKLQEGDRVAIREGNGTCLCYVGLFATLHEFYPDKGKWGLKTLADASGRGGGQLVMIMPGNLERARDEPAISSIP